MSVTMLDWLISAMRPVIVKGKGFALDPVTPRRGTRHATVAGSYAMTLDLGNAIHRQIYMGCFANAMTRWSRALLRAGGTFLDVGAHAGYFTLIAAHRVGPTGRILAIEPNPASVAALRRHLETNQIQHVDVIDCAVGEHEGRVELHVPGGEILRDYNATLLHRSDWTAVDVRMRRLDDCLDAWGVKRIDLMKIDVEGGEPRVLAGGSAHLAAGTIRHLMIEINGPRLVEAGSSPAALVDTLAGLGFEPARLAGGRVTRIARSDVDLDPAHEHDRLFVHAKASDRGRIERTS